MVSYIAAFLAGVTNATSNVLNRKATKEEPARLQFRVRLLTDLLRRRTGLTAVAIMLVSFLLSALALGTGQLATVQIIVILELPMTLVGGVMILHSRLGKREWAAVAGMTLGVAGLLVCLDPRPGRRPPVTAVEWIIGSAVTAGPALAFFLLARRPASPARQAALLGMSTGASYGLASVYTKGMTQQFTSGGLAAILTSWQLYAAGVAGLAATWLLQNAYHAGRLAAAQPGITFLDPAAATAWGVIVFGEQTRSGPVLALSALPIAALAGSVFLLSRSPALRAAAGADESAKRGARGSSPPPRR